MNKNGFSLVEMVVTMVIVVVVMAASMTFVNLKKITLGTHMEADKCIVNDSGSPATANCQQAIADCKYNRGNSCETAIYLSSESAYATAAKNILKQACTEGSETACDYFIEQCASDNTKCDISESTNDLRYFLALDANSNVKGKLYIYKKVKKWFTDQVSNLETEVLAACTAHPNSIACKIISQKIYNFNRPQRDEFTEEDDINGTTFDNGLVTLIEQGVAGFAIKFSPHTFNWYDWYGNDMVVDDDGSFYVASTGDSDKARLLKFDSEGNLLWARENSSSDMGLWIPSLAKDSAGNIYVGTTEGYLWKVDSSGNKIWIRGMNSVIGMNRLGVAIRDISGSDMVYIAGYNDPDLRIMRLDTDGNIQAQTEINVGSTFTSRVNMAIDSSGNLYISMRENKSIAGSLFLKLNSSLSILWDYTMNDSCYGGPIAVDSNDNLYALQGAHDSNNFSIYFIKFNSSGVVQWKKNLGDTGTDRNFGAIFIDNSDNVYITGQHAYSSETFGGEDAYVAKVNSSTGDLEWVRGMGTTGNDTGYAITGNNNGSLFINGYIGTTESFIIKMSDTQTDNISLTWNNYSYDPESISLSTSSQSKTFNTQSIDLDNYTSSITVSTLDPGVFFGLDDLAGLTADSRYYITTTDTNQVSEASTVVSIDITQTTPSDTDIKWLVSFDGRSTWHKLTGANCASTEVTSDVSTYDFSATDAANDYTEIESYMAGCDISTNGTLDFAIDLETTHDTNVPSLDKIIINYY